MRILALLVACVLSASTTFAASIRGTTQRALAANTKLVSHAITSSPCILSMVKDTCPDLNMCYELSGAETMIGSYGMGKAGAFLVSVTSIPHGCQNFYDDAYPAYSRMLFNTANSGVVFENVAGVANDHCSSGWCLRSSSTKISPDITEDGDITCLITYINNNKEDVKGQCAGELETLQAVLSTLSAAGVVESEKHIRRLYGNDFTLLGELQCLDEAGAVIEGSTTCDEAACKGPCADGTGKWSRPLSEAGGCIREMLTASDKFDCGDPKGWVNADLVEPSTLYCQEMSFANDIDEFAKECTTAVYGELLYDREDTFGYLLPEGELLLLDQSVCFARSGAETMSGSYGMGKSGAFLVSVTYLPHGCQRYEAPTAYPSYSRMLFNTANKINPAAPPATIMVNSRPVAYIGELEEKVKAVSESGLRVSELLRQQNKFEQLLLETQHREQSVNFETMSDERKAEIIRASFESMTQSMRDSFVQGIAQKIADVHIMAAGKMKEMHEGENMRRMANNASSAGITGSTGSLIQSDEKPGWVETRKEEIKADAKDEMRKDFKDWATEKAKEMAVKMAENAYDNVNREPYSSSCKNAKSQYAELEQNFNSYVDGPIRNVKETADNILGKLDDFNTFQEKLATLDERMGTTKNLAKTVGIAFAWLTPVKVVARTIEKLVKLSQPPVSAASTKATNVYDTADKARPFLEGVSEKSEKLLDAIETTKEFLANDVAGNLYAVDRFFTNWPGRTCSSARSCPVPGCVNNPAQVPCDTLYNYCHTVNTKIDEVEERMLSMIGARLDPFKNMLDKITNFLDNQQFKDVLAFFEIFSPILDLFNKVLDFKICIPNPFSVTCSGCSGCSWGGCSGCSDCKFDSICPTIREVLDLVSIIIGFAMSAVESILDTIIPGWDNFLPKLEWDFNFDFMHLDFLSPAFELSTLDINLPNVGFSTVNICGVNRPIQDCGDFSKWFNWMKLELPDCIPSLTLEESHAKFNAEREAAGLSPLPMPGPGVIPVVDLL